MKELCDAFYVETRHIEKLNELMKDRVDTWDEDLRKLLNCQGKPATVHKDSIALQCKPRNHEAYQAMSDIRCGGQAAIRSHCAGSTLPGHG